jgi:ABC-2 type transport system permease protein
MKWFTFAKRNFLETIRDPLSLLFCFLFPILIFVIFEIVGLSLPSEALASVPQFQTKALYCTMPIFGFTFLMLFVALLVSKDRGTAFITRLRTSPMKASDFILGYTFATLPIGLLQLVLNLVLALCFGYYKNFSGYSLLSLLLQLPMMFVFIGLGLLLGTCFIDKAVGGIASGLVTLSIFLSGMFMPVETLSDGLQITMKTLPFYNGTLMAKNAEAGIFNGNWVWEPIVIVFAYGILIFASAILAFNLKAKADQQ